LLKINTHFTAPAPFGCGCFFFLTQKPLFFKPLRKNLRQTGPTSKIVFNKQAKPDTFVTYISPSKLSLSGRCNLSDNKALHKPLRKKKLKKLAG